MELDGLRGIAATAVLVRHFTSTYDHFFPGEPTPPFAWEDGRYGVPFFFLISGYVILMTARRSRSAAEFAIARFARLFPAYWTAIALTSLTVALLGPALLQRTPTEIITNLSMVQAAVGVRHIDDSYWSLSVELLFYALIVLAVWRRATSDRAIVTVALGWVAVGLVVAAVYAWGGRTSGLWRLVILTGAEFPSLFTVGILAMISQGRRLHRATVPVLVAGAVISTLIIDLRHAVVITLISTLFLCITRYRSVGLLRWRPLLFLGAISYPLYLTHQFIGYALIHALTPHVGRTSSMLLATGLVIVVSFAIHKLVEERASRALRMWMVRRWSLLRPVVSHER